MILALDDALDDLAEEFGEDGHADRVDEDCEKHPPGLTLLIIFAKLIDFVFHDDGRCGGYDSEQRVEQKDDEVAEADATAIVIDDLLDDLALPLVVGELGVFLVALDTALDLLLFLVQAPNVLNSRLLALPRLNVEGGPECNEQDVEVVDGRVHILQVRDEVGRAFFLVLGTKHQMQDPDSAASHGLNRDPADVVQDEGEVEGVLLSVVVGDQVDRLKVVPEAFAHGNEVDDEPHDVLVEGLDDLELLARVRHKVLIYNASLDQSSDIELLLKLGLHEAVALGRFETLVETATRVLERQSLELVLQLDHKALVLGFFVECLIVEEHQNEHFLFWLESIAILSEPACRLFITLFTLLVFG